MAIWRQLSFEHVADADMALYMPTSCDIRSTGGVNGNYLELELNSAAWIPLPQVNAASIWGHFRVYIVQVSNSVLSFISFGETSSIHIVFKIEGTLSDLYLKAYSSTGLMTNNAPAVTLIAAGTFPMAAYTWYSVAYELTVNATTGVVKTWINGVADINATGADTYNAGAVGVSKIVMWAIGSRVDDFIVGDTTGVHTQAIGEVRVDCHFPVTPNGTDSEWTRSAGSDNWTLVDDPAASAGVSDYIESTAVGDQTSFHVEALKVVGGNIHGVQATAYLTKMNAGPGGVKPYVLRGGTRYYGPEWYPSFGSWQFFQYVWDQDPAAGPGAWSETNFNNSEFGLERTT